MDQPENKINFLEEISNYIFISKYARYNELLERRETWEECVDRVTTMHINRFRKKVSKEDLTEIKWAFQQVKDKKVVPSMRSMQFGGKAIEAHSSRIYNCSVRHIDSIRSFAESFYLLLCGCGVGFGLTNRFLDRLPNLVDASNKTGIVITYVVEDSIEGWSDSIEALLNCYFKNTAYTGRKIVFDYSKIRPEGAPLKTGGGKAPGYKGLKNCHKKIKILLDYIIEDLGQNRLKTINAYDILMHIADAVLSGGIRRSACSIVFDIEDQDMMNAKVLFDVTKYTKFSFDDDSKKHYGKVTVNKKIYDIEIEDKDFEYEYKLLTEKKQIYWKHIEPQRGRSNNSVLLLRDKCTIEQFKDIIQKTQQYGEPGFVFADAENILFNPCFTIDSQILTDEGWRTFEELLNRESVNIIQDNRVYGFINENGQESWDIDLKRTGISKNIATKIQQTGTNQDIYLLTMNCGRTVKATGNHLFATTKGMKNLKDLKPSDNVLLPVNDLYQPNQNSLSFKEGYLCGLIFGDGTFTEQEAIIDLWDENYKSIESIVHEVLNNHMDVQNKTHQKLPTFNLALSTNKYNKYRMTSSHLHKTILKKGFTKNNLKWIHHLNKDFKSGFAAGLMYTDGHVDFNQKKKSLSLRITNTNFSALQELSLVLQELGILSNIKNLLPEGYRTLPDGKGNDKEYFCKKTFRLIISGKINAAKAATFILIHPDKKLKFDTIYKSLQNNTRDCKYYSKVESVKYIGKENVYCLKEDNKRTLIANGLTARRCFEISFEPIDKEGLTGTQFCNLSSINGAKVNSLEDFMSATKAATIIGTLQASYTDHITYLNNTAKKLTEEEALLGVSITGMMDNPKILLDPENQKKAANYAKEINEIWANKIGINPAARVTCCKPEGTSSLVLQSASGIHPHHARRYFRRVQANKIDPVYKYFKQHNPHMCEESVWSANNTDDVICFPIEVSDQALIKSDLTAIQHLEIIKSTQKNWVIEGTSKYNKKNIHHNVSCTVIIKEDEWDNVINYLYENREYFCAVSLLPFVGDKLYKQAPMEAIIDEKDKNNWDNIIKNYNKVDYKKLIENSDTTKIQETSACAGGKCELY